MVFNEWCLNAKLGSVVLPGDVKNLKIYSILVIHVVQTQCVQMCESEVAKAQWS